MLERLRQGGLLPAPRSSAGAGSQIEPVPKRGRIDYGRGKGSTPYAKIEDVVGMLRPAAPWPTDSQLLHQQPGDTPIAGSTWTGSR